jgi:hypothetical protein
MARLLELESGLVMLGDPNAAWIVRPREATSPSGLEGTEPNGRGVGGEVRAAHADAPRPVPTVAVQPDAARLDQGLVEAAADRLREFPEDPDVFFRRVADATGVPALTQPEYTRLFAAVAEAAAVPDLDFNGRAGRIRDDLQAGGMQVSRAQVNSVLNVFRQNGIEIARHDVGSLAAAWRDITLARLRNAQVPLSREKLDSSTGGCWESWPRRERPNSTPPAGRPSIRSRRPGLRSRRARRRPDLGRAAGRSGIAGR